MKFSESWLREWVNPTISSQTLCEQITMLGLEVDAVEAVAGEFNGVIIGEVVACEPHPDADKLRITKVNVGGDSLLDIVCGAPNCRKGLKVACATVGAVLPGNFKIKKAKLRGQLSEGMLCSYEELGIKSDANGIIELPQDAPIGQDIRDYLQLNDQQIEISLTPNRADCLSIAGIAREVALANQLVVTPPHFADVTAHNNESVAMYVEIPQACPRYLLRPIKNVNVNAPSPLWLQEKLRRCGVRSIDAIVDITNYVLLELGQPMHAFDADKLSLPLCVRMAKDKEKLVLLDGNEVALKDNTLVIADQNGPVAMAGIFGGLHTGVTAKTQNIILEAAFFAPLSIVNRARQYGLHTDSSHRFERGVDYQLQYQAMQRATQLIVEICGGDVGEISESVSLEHLPQAHSVRLRREKLDKLLGYVIPHETVTQILQALGLNPIYYDNKQQWHCDAPSWRFDIEIEEDLIEEIARIYGYNQLPETAPLAHLKMNERKESALCLNRVKFALVDQEYQEAITYSFVDPKKQAWLFPEIKPLMLPNPISSDMSAMRVSLLTGLLSTLEYNQKRQQQRIRLFETGYRFIPDASAEMGVKQEMMISLVATGSKSPEHWSEKSQYIDFFDLKGDIETLLSLTNARNQIKFVAKSYHALHPGQSASILLDGVEIGFIGTLHPKIAQQLDLNGKVVVAEILWSAIDRKSVPNATEISRFPANRRDLALVVAQDIAAADILTACRQVAGDKLTDVNLFDVYQGTGVATGHKSLAISLTIQDKQKTLEDSDINEVVSAVLAELSQRFQAYLRD